VGGLGTTPHAGGVTGRRLHLWRGEVHGGLFIKPFIHANFPPRTISFHHTLISHNIMRLIDVFKNWIGGDPKLKIELLFKIHHSNFTEEFMSPKRENK
jgi:hypothetical protein